MKEIEKTLCQSLEDCVYVEERKREWLAGMKLVEDGEMAQEPDLSKCSEFNCEGIVKNIEDEISPFFQKRGYKKLFDVQEQYCDLVVSLCSDIKDGL